METLLKDQSGDGSNKDGPNATSLGFTGSHMHQSGLGAVPGPNNIAIGEVNNHDLEAMSRLAGTSSIPNPEAFAGTLGEMSIDQQADDSFPWEMIGLGLEEPLPSQDVINELYVD